MQKKKRTRKSNECEKLQFNPVIKISCSFKAFLFFCGHKNDFLIKLCKLQFPTSTILTAMKFLFYSWKRSKLCNRFFRKFAISLSVHFNQCREARAFWLINFMIWHSDNMKNNNVFGDGKKCAFTSGANLFWFNFISWFWMEASSGIKWLHCILG